MTNYSNIAVQTVLAGAILAGDLTLTVADPTGYPAAPFRIVVDPGSVANEEVLEVTVTAGALFTVTRGFDGTTAKPHANGATVIHAAIAADFTDLQAADTALSTTISTHIADLSNPHSVTAAQTGALTQATADLLYAHLDAANVFTVGQQTIQANARIGATGAAASRLRVDDSGSSANYITELHADDSVVWAFGIYNDTYDATTPTLAAWSEDTGAAWLGTDAANDLIVYTSATERMRLTASGAIVLAAVPSLPIQNANLVFAGPSSGGAATPTFRALEHADLASGGGTGTKYLRDDLTWQAIGAGVSGSGTIGRVAQFSGATAIGDSNLTGPASNLLNLAAASNNITLTIPATGTAALLGTANVFTAGQTIAIDDAITNTTTTLATVKHTSSGTPAASFGSRLLWQLESSTTADQDAAALDVLWSTSTHASRTSKASLKLVNLAGALTERLSIDGFGFAVITAAKDITDSTEGFGIKTAFTLGTSSNFGSWANGSAAATLNLGINAAGANRTAYGVVASAAYRGNGDNSSTVGGGLFYGSIEVNGFKVTDLVGGEFQAQSQSNRSSWATNYYAGRFQVLAEASAGAGRTATLAAGVYVKTPTSSNVTITTAYGLYIEAQSVGSTKYAIYTNAGLIRFGDTITQTVADSATNAATTVRTNQHNSTGTPADGFGSTELWTLQSSTTVNRSAADWTTSWATATDASRKARIVGSAYDTAAREWIRGEASGSAAMIGFLGAAAVVKQTSGADLTNNVTIGGTDNTIADFTDLATYATDAATIRNDIYQLARKLKQVNDALRLYGLLT